MLEELKEKVCKANLELVRHGLVLFTWGNASAIDRPSGLVVIKPSGVSYDDMKPSDMVVVDLRPLQGLPWNRRSRAHAFNIRYGMGPGRKEYSQHRHDTRRLFP